MVNSGHPWSLDLSTVLSFYPILWFLSYGFSNFQQWIWIIFVIRTKPKLITKINTTVLRKFPQQLKLRWEFLYKWFSVPMRKTTRGSEKSGTGLVKELTKNVISAEVQPQPETPGSSAGWKGPQSCFTMRQMVQEFRLYYIAVSHQLWLTLGRKA